MMIDKMAHETNRKEFLPPTEQDMVVNHVADRRQRKRRRTHRE